MAMLKCKMCGGDMELSPNQRCATCKYCGSTMTLPKVDDEQQAAAFNRGNHFRRTGEFDKALTVYERIIQENENDAEAHWCCALCRFGIEYVKDPTSGEYLPTCHRASLDSFLEDVDYKAALQYADAVAKRQYEQDGTKIAQVQRGILSVSQKERPFDVFICYKESDEQGNRTVDSALAQDIYYHLTDQGFRVFFSRITLEDKAGQAYEPYIFAALHSAKVMIVVGTKPEYLNAVWVKNEWSRYLSIVKNDRKKLLIPCYRDMDPYDMPEQLSVLQSYDMNKIGFIQDLIRGISKVIVKGPSVQEAVKETVVVQSEANTNLTALLKRGYMSLENQEWGRADEFFEQVLNLNAECAEAYLGKLCAEKQCKRDSNLQNLDEPFSDSYNYQRVIQFGNLVQREFVERANQLVVDTFVEKTRMLEQIRNNISKVNRCICTGIFATAGVKSDGTVTVVGINGYNVGDWKNLISICLGHNHLVGLKLDGTVEATTSLSIYKQHIENWKDIIAISCGDNHTVGLKSDGTVVATGDNMCGQCNVENWKDIVTIACGDNYTVGLRSDGTVRIAGGYNSYNTGTWKDIVSISCGKDRVIGIKADATVTAAGYNLGDECNVKDWKNIISVGCGESHAVGLKSDGTVVATGDNMCGQCDVEDWKGIVAISCGEYRTIGLKADGTVIATGESTSGQCDVEEWKDIVAISCGGYHTVGLKSDGTVVATGGNIYGQCDVGSWRLFKSIDSIEQERNEAEKSWREKVQRCRELELERNQLQAEFQKLKSLFTIGKRRQIESRLSEIEMELKALHW